MTVESQQQGEASITEDTAAIAGMVPRSPSEIRPTQHFLRRFSSNHGPSSETRRAPPITGDVVHQCITEGVVSHGQNGAICYETHVDGHLWRVVVGFDPEPVVITAYVPGVHGATEYGGVADD